MVLEAISRSGRLSLGDKLYEINWGFVLLLTAIASVGFAMLYSAADGNFDPWASRQMVRFAMGMVLLMVFAVIDPRVWMQLAYPAYGFALRLILGLAVLLLAAMAVIQVWGAGTLDWLLGPQGGFLVRNGYGTGNWPNVHGGGMQRCDTIVVVVYSANWLKTVTAFQVGSKRAVIKSFSF